MVCCWSYEWERSYKPGTLEFFQRQDLRAMWTGAEWLVACSAYLCQWASQPTEWVCVCRSNRVSSEVCKQDAGGRVVCECDQTPSIIMPRARDEAQRVETWSSLSLWIRRALQQSVERGMAPSFTLGWAGHDTVPLPGAAPRGHHSANQPTENSLRPVGPQMPSTGCDNGDFSHDNDNYASRQPALKSLRANDRHTSSRMIN